MKEVSQNVATCEKDMIKEALNWLRSRNYCVILLGR